MIIHRYILKNHVVPFIFSIFTIFSVLLLQYLMKMADNLIGKGLSFWIISKFIIYSLSWMVVLVVPMSVLVSTLMAFGGMAQNNEIAVLKASGVSLYRMMAAPFIGSIIIAALLIQFNNNVYPDTNHAARLLIQDIRKKKPTLSLVPGVFSQDVENYSILAREVNSKTNELGDLTIYDYSEPDKINIVTAEKGNISFSNDQTKLMLILFNGEIHETEITDRTPYRKLVFDKHKIIMDARDFTFQQTTSAQRHEREMSASQMWVVVDSMETVRQSYKKSFDQKIKLNLHAGDIIEEASAENNIRRKHVLLKVREIIRSTENSINSSVSQLQLINKDMNKYLVEIHKKYSLPVACIVFFFIGVSMGTMMRKGGFGVAAGVSLVYFLIYWAFLIGGEKLADRGLLSAFWGMWSANIVLGTFGILITIRAARERVNINFDFLQKLLPKQLRNSSKENEDS